MTPPEISILIVNYNGWHWLEGCLTAALADARDDGGVVLVDNIASTDGSAAFVREQFPRRTVDLASRQYARAKGR